MLTDYLRLLRPHQWYKNLVIFVAVFFTGRFFHYNDLLLTIIGFMALSLVSSANYIINDIHDAKEDRKHPEKKKRPIASRKVAVIPALVIALLLLSLSVLIAGLLSKSFMILIIALFAFTQVYTFWLKKEQFIDLIMVGINFVLRAIAGAFIINAEISPWLVFCAFFLALFLITGKRLSDLEFSGSRYTKNILEKTMTALLASLLISYSFYTFLKGNNGFIFTIPFVLYGLLYYLELAEKGSRIARNPELSITDARLAATVFLWGAIAFISLYVIK